MYLERQNHVIITINIYIIFHSKNTDKLSFFSHPPKKLFFLCYVFFDVDYKSVIRFERLALEMCFFFKFFRFGGMLVLILICIKYGRSQLYGKYCYPYNPRLGCTRKGYSMGLPLLWRGCIYMMAPQLFLIRKSEILLSYYYCTDCYVLGEATVFGGVL